MENTTKKAFIVCISPMTRVVVDTKGKAQDEIEAEAIESAIEKMKRNVNEYLTIENCDDIREDIECPAQPNE